MKGFLRTPTAKIIVSLLIGIGLLWLASRFADISAAIQVLQRHLETPRGILFALLAGVCFLFAFSIRGVRWTLFLKPIGNIRSTVTIRLVFISIFINFLLPISVGELAKTIILRRIAGIPMSRSLPTVAMDRSMDLLPALLIMVLVPVLGIEMDVKLWLILYVVGGLLIGLVCFVGLAVWKRATAITLLGTLTALLPGTIGGKIASFATGFVDSLLIGASRPHMFIPAVLLTCLAVVFDSLFAWFSFHTIGLPVPFGTILFGYTVYNMFYILPTPPGQIGSNEALGLLVFTGLLHLSPRKVAAMFIFSHSWAALLMCTAGLLSLRSLGVTLPAAMKVQPGESNQESGKERADMLSSEPQKVSVLS